MMELQHFISGESDVRNTTDLIAYVSRPTWPPNAET
jgi:hypothetical protein